MGIGPYTMLAIRLPVVDYLSPVYSDAMTMVMRRPHESVAQSALLVAKPFKGKNIHITVSWANQWQQMFVKAHVKIK